DAVSSEKRRPVPAAHRVPVEISAGIAGDRRRQGPAASDLDDAVQLPAAANLPHRSEIEPMPLVSSSETPFVAGIERIVARATKNLIPRRRAPVDQLGKCVIGEKLKTTRVSLVCLDEK